MTILQNPRNYQEKQIALTLKKIQIDLSKRWYGKGNKTTSSVIIENNGSFVIQQNSPQKILRGLSAFVIKQDNVNK